MIRSIRPKRKNDFAKFDSYGNITDDSSDNMASADVQNPKIPNRMNNIEKDFDDSNDSYGGFKDTSFTDNKDFNLSIAERKQHRQRNMHSKSSDESRLQQCLDYIHRLLSRKDKEDFFQFPVTDLIAPGYSSIIKNPMDFSSMKKKIDNGSYTNILEYRDDFVLMCENAMTYNKSDTIYYYAARKLLDSGLKSLNKEKLVSLRRSLGIMKNLTHAELGFVPDGEVETPSEPTPVPRKKHVFKSYKHDYYPSQYQLVAKSSILRKLEFYHYDQNDAVEDITTDCQSMAKSAANKLQAKFPNSKLGYLRRNSNGTTSLNFLNQYENTVDKQLTVGSFCDVLNSGSYSLNSFAEDKKNKAKPMYYLEYGPFSSHAPTYDSTFGNLTKDESDLLMSTYGDEQGYQYAASLMEFAKGTGPLFNKYLNHVLNTLTNNQHDKYLEAKNKSTEQNTENTATVNISSVQMDSTDDTNKSLDSSKPSVDNEPPVLNGTDNKPSDVVSNGAEPVSAASIEEKQQ